MLIAYLTSQISNMERTTSIYLTKQIPAGLFANVRGLLCLWDFVNLYNPRLKWACDYLALLQLNHRKSCSMVGRQAGCCKEVGNFILNGIHFSHKQKKGNSLWLQRRRWHHRAVVRKVLVAADPFHCTQNRCGPHRFVNVFRLLAN